MLGGINRVRASINSIAMSSAVPILEVAQWHVDGDDDGRRRWHEYLKAEGQGQRYSCGALSRRRVFVCLFVWGKRKGPNLAKAREHSIVPAAHVHSHGFTPNPTATSIWVGNSALAAGVQPERTERISTAAGCSILGRRRLS